MNIIALDRCRVESEGRRRRQRQRHQAPRQRQRGLSLSFALVALVGLSLAGLGMMRATDISTLIAGNLGFRETAAKATDLGLEAGIAGLTAMTVDERKNHRSSSNYFASLESVNLAPSTSRLGTNTPAGNTIADSATGNSVRYVIERMCQGTGAHAAASCVMDAAGTGAMYRVTALALGPHNASQMAQAMVAVDVPVPGCSMMMQAAVTVAGANTQNGSSKCYHSNTSILISGAAGNSGIDATAVGSASYTGGGGFTVATHAGEPARTLPVVSPVAHKPYATHVFTAAGGRTNIAGTTAATAGDWVWEPGASPPQWKLNNDKDSACPPSGRYYFETNVEIPKKIGSGSLTCVLSIISEQSLKISGGPIYLSNYRGTPPATVPAATSNVFLMAGGDLELPGNSFLYDGTQKSALVSAQAEIKVNGNVTLEGALVARNEPAAAGSLAIDTANTVSGTVVQTYNGGGASGPTTATRRSWRFATR